MRVELTKQGCTQTVPVILERKRTLGRSTLRRHRWAATLRLILDLPAAGLPPASAVPLVGRTTHTVAVNITSAAVSVRKRFARALVATTYASCWAPGKPPSGVVPVLRYHCAPEQRKRALDYDRAG